MSGLDVKLAKLAKQLPKSLRDKITQRVDVFKEQREHLNELANKRGMTIKQREGLIRLKNQEYLYKQKEEVNQEVAKKMDKELNNLIKTKINRGELNLNEGRKEYLRFMNSRR